MKKNELVLIIAVYILFCLAGPVLATDERWHPFNGVTYIHRTQTLPRLLSMHILVIDLHAQDIGFLVTPPNGDLAGNTNKQTASSFLKSCNAQMAINGDFFWDDPQGQSVTTSVCGFAASKGEIYNPFQSGWEYAINFSKDNAATLIEWVRGSSNTQYAPANVSIYNAIAGAPKIISDGRLFKCTDPTDTAAQLHPRTAIGLTGDDKLVLFVVDGRYNQGKDTTDVEANERHGSNGGMTTLEEAEVLLSLGVVNAINLDGGGSSTMVIADPNVRIVNRPSDSTGERKTGNQLAVFAKLAEPKPSAFVYNNFDCNDEGTFCHEPTFSEDTKGILKTSTADAVDLGNNQTCEKIVIYDDPSISKEGWFVRFASDSSGSHSQNIARKAVGYVGFWAKTTDSGMKISLAVNNADQIKRGCLLKLISDGKWHYYQWNLGDSKHWEGLHNDNGKILHGDFTLDSIQIFGGNTKGTVYIDTIMHNPNGRIDDEIKIPVSAQMLK
jgi:exopolysaccharide biosynthesis protein